MKINSILLKKLRAEKHWSQEQLCEACELSLRTVQRLEKTGNASLESVKALAAVFDIAPDELIVEEVQNQSEEDRSPIKVVKTCFAKFANFSDTATKYEFWWFCLFVVLVLAIATVINAKLVQIVSLFVLVPFLAVSTRRLNHTGESAWWQLFYLVPFGVILVFYMLAQDGHNKTQQTVLPN